MHAGRTVQINYNTTTISSCIESSSKSTYYWADNLNKLIEIDKFNVIDSIHTVQFLAKLSIKQIQHFSCNKSKSISESKLLTTKEQSNIYVDPKNKNPPVKFEEDLFDSDRFVKEGKEFSLKYLLWILLQCKSSKSLRNPSLLGWLFLV